METQTVHITPKLAAQYLKLNTRNRNLSKAKVAQFADDMAHDRWDETHQGIGFYKDGVLADGQTRLHAIVASNKAVNLLVTRGMPNEAGASIDKHRPRSDADSISISQLSNWIGKDQVSLVKMIASAHSRTNTTYSPKHLAELGDFLRRAVQFGLSAFTSRKRHITTSPVMAAVAIASTHTDLVRLLEFVEVLVHGVPTDMDDVAAIRLREQLINQQGRGGQTARRETLLKTMRAIKAFEEREHIQKLYTPPEMIYRVEGIEDYL